MYLFDFSNYIMWVFKSIVSEINWGELAVINELINKKNPHKEGFFIIILNTYYFPLRNGSPVFVFSTTVLPAGRSQAPALASFAK